jgi:hypothetical protein
LLNSVLIAVTFHADPRLLIDAELYYYAGMGPFNPSAWDLVIFWMWCLSVIVPEFYYSTSRIYKEISNCSAFKITLCSICYTTPPELTPSKHRESNGLAFI